MKKIDLLRELQELDTALDRAREKIDASKASFGDESELIPLRERLESTRKELRALQTKGMDLDLKLEKEVAKRKADEKKLYDGSIKNPKELGSLAQDVEAQKERISRLEDQVLMNMDALESTSLLLKEAEKQLAEKEQRWRAEQAALDAEIKLLSAEIEQLNSNRARVVEQIDRSTLRTYESLRRSRGGLAVVPVEQRACRGCRINLSSSEVQRARSSSEPVFCQSCGRFLYVP
ncbi:MAG: zinc ribbon domain-containing protein [Chloroflexota bacterium]